MITDRIVPIILAGGAGTRLWPLSRKAMPKQFLPLLGPRSTYQETLRRVSDRRIFTPPIVITNAEFRFFARRQAEAMNVEVEIILEPALRDSAPALAAATVFAARGNPDVALLALAADHLVTDQKAFEHDCLLAHQSAQQGNIVTFGIAASRPDTGFGYIEKGAPLGDGIFRVATFREKPDLATATGFVREGFLWNSGNFAYRADVMLRELETYAPQVSAAAAEAVARAQTDLGFLRLDTAAFSAAPKISIDHAVMERTDKAAVVAAGFPWSDVGTWDSVRSASTPDPAGNVTAGAVMLQQTSQSYVRSDGPLTAVIGLDNVIVVATGDAVLVTSAEAAPRVKQLVEALDKNGERAVREHPQSHRPWGWYQDIDRGDRFRVKRIVVEPGQALSLQRHHHRAEHWVVVRGTAEITIGSEIKLVHENQSVYIPLGEMHRLANPGKMLLELIEVQTGSYLEEDDIVRFEDVYSRE